MSIIFVCDKCKTKFDLTKHDIEIMQDDYVYWCDKCQVWCDIV